jgi:hypothetical protein
VKTQTARNMRIDEELEPLECAASKIQTFFKFAFQIYFGIHTNTRNNIGARGRVRKQLATGCFQVIRINLLRFARSNDLRVFADSGLRFKVSPAVV